MTIRIIAGVWCVCSVLLLLAPQVDAAQLRVVATTNVAVAGAAKPFDGFGFLSLNNHGHVAFNAWQIVNPLRLDSGGVWTEGYGVGLTMVDPPGYGHWDLVLNDMGVVSFTNGWLMQGSSVENGRVVAATGQPAPGLPSTEASFEESFYYTGSAFNDRNEVAFVKKAGGYARLYAGASQDSLRLVASAGQQIIDGKGASYIHSLSVQNLNDAGDLLFYARMYDNPSYNGQPRLASYLWTHDQELELVASSGDSIVTDRGIIEVSSVNSQLNNSGQVGLMINHSVLAVSSPAGYKVVATEEDSIGDERVFYFTNEWALAGNGAVVYAAAMIGGSAVPNETRMLFKNSPGESPTIVARTLTPAPGAPDGQVFSMFFSSFAVNGHGQVALYSDLIDAATRERTGHGIWMENKYGVLESVVQTGDFVDVDGGPGIDLREIIEVRGFAMGGSQSGMASQFNDRGQVAFVATFADFSQAILVSAATVPEPSGLSMLLCGLTLGGLRGFRSRQATEQAGGGCE